VLSALEHENEHIKEQIKLLKVRAKEYKSEREAQRLKKKHRKQKKEEARL
jgi:hypothetical protein